jgi:hypothetical protein
MASIALAVLCLFVPVLTFAEEKGEHEQQRVTESGQALDELVNSQSGIPTDLLNRSAEQVGMRHHPALGQERRFHRGRPIR